MTNFTNEELEVLRPFGPTIAKVKMPKDLIDKLNEYTESILSDQNKQDELDYGNKLAVMLNKNLLLKKIFQKKVDGESF